MSNKELRILIVEDNDIYRELFRNSLQRAFPKLAIDEAADGCEALQKSTPFFPTSSSWTFTYEKKMA